MRRESPARIIGRYALHDEFAAGGMASVHLGTSMGPAGFSRTVAIKRLHAHFAGDPEFSAMFLDEARLAARIHHPNVVPTVDVVAHDGELLLVMEYVHGLSLTALRRELGPTPQVPAEIAAAILSGVLQGLHAAHEARDERGEPLGIVHRDVSPQNVIVGVDGVARVLDFGIAKAIGRLANTRPGDVKGKLAYMAPEQVRGLPVTRRVDVFAASVVLWEILTGERLFAGDSDGETLHRLLEAEIEPPSDAAPDVPPALDQVVLRGLARDPDARFASAKEMAEALERAATPATQQAVAAWIEHIAGGALRERGERVDAIERSARTSPQRAPMEVTPPAKNRRPARPVVAISIAVVLGAVVYVGTRGLAAPPPAAETALASAMVTAVVPTASEPAMPPSASSPPSAAAASATPPRKPAGPRPRPGTSAPSAAPPSIYTPE